jgi:hypothetical protein
MLQIYTPVPYFFQTSRYRIPSSHFRRPSSHLTRGFLTWTLYAFLVTHIRILVQSTWPSLCCLPSDLNKLVHLLVCPPSRRIPLSDICKIVDLAALNVSANVAAAIFRINDFQSGFDSFYAVIATYMWFNGGVGKARLIQSVFAFMVNVSVALLITWGEQVRVLTSTLFCRSRCCILPLRSVRLSVPNHWPWRWQL